MAVKSWHLYLEEIMSNDTLIKNIELLEILLEGCRTHPAYRARRSATGNCTNCVVVLTAQQPLKELNDD
jgi:hypothetical protein